MHIDQAIVRSTILVSLDAWAFSLLIKKHMLPYLDGVSSFLGMHILLNAVLVPLGFFYPLTNLYAVAFYGLYGLLYCASLYLVRSIWKVGLEKYPGFQRLGIMAMAFTVVALSLFVNIIVSQSPGVSNADNWVNMWFALMMRCLNFVIAGLLLMFFALASTFRVGIGRTVRNVAGSLFAYSIVRALLQTWLYHRQYLGSQAYEWVWSMSTGVMVFSWGWTIRRHHANDPSEIPPLFGTSRSRETVELQAQALNRQLTRLIG